MARRLGARASLTAAVSLGALLAARPLAAQADTIPFTPGMVIDRSVVIAPGTYRVSAPASLDSALVTVRGSGITLDLRGVVLVGADPDGPPDAGTGVALAVDGGRDVTIRGARIRGYRFAVIARGTRGLRILENELNYTWKPQLFSLPEHESLVDWLSFHHNEAGEWLRFGAAIYLDGVRGGEVAGNRAMQGMNGLLMTRTDSLVIRDNIFAFNSGLGIGLYRSSDNLIVANALDFNVRGYSHGVYRRGQDSAGLLLYEQSRGNVVAYNSVTHGGDGLFLWAGQETMDAGTGGANDNVFFENDFSFAPTNAIEATFSRNAFVANRATGSDHGLWGGYSYESAIAGNCFAGNRVGIAIEHGQDNVITANRFRGDGTAIRLWANPIEPSDWGYPKHRDTRSRGYRIEGNAFLDNRVALRAGATTHLSFVANRAEGVDTLVVTDTTTRVDADDTAVTAERPTSGGGVDPCVPSPALPEPYLHLAPALDTMALERPAPPLARRDRSAIVVDAWGPYDWRSPKLWPVDSTRAVPLRLAVLGPPGDWLVVASSGIQPVATTAGAVGDTIAVLPRSDRDEAWSLTLAYRGEAVTMPNGTTYPAGTPVRFSYGRFEPVIEWDVRWVSWSDATDPRSASEAFAARFDGEPILRQRVSRLDYMWYRPPYPDLPREQVALRAAGHVLLLPGSYLIRAISDDGVRVWIDGTLTIDAWTAHESAAAFAPLTGGRHDLTVEYYQDGGWTELRVEILPNGPRSPGSPGPH